MEVKPTLRSIDSIARRGVFSRLWEEWSPHREKEKLMEDIIAAIAEIKRERTVRATVYRRLVENGKLTQAEADRRASALAWAEAYLRKLCIHWHAIQKLDAEHKPTPPTIRD